MVRLAIGCESAAAYRVLGPGLTMIGCEGFAMGSVGAVVDLGSTSRLPLLRLPPAADLPSTGATTEGGACAADVLCWSSSALAGWELALWLLWTASLSSGRPVRRVVCV